MEGRSHEDVVVAPKMRRDELGLIIFAALSTFLFAGSFYGWGPMQLLLEDNGHFNQKCSPQSPDEVCDEQTAALLNVRMVSQLMSLTCPLLGWLADSRGPVKLLHVMAVSTVLGLIALVVPATFPGDVDGLLYLSFIGMGIAATCGALLTVQTGLVFVGTNPQRCNRVISVLNSLYDAGAVSFLGLWGLTEVSDSLSLTSLAVGYLVLAFLCFTGYIYYFRTVLHSSDKAEAGSQGKKCSPHSMDDEKPESKEPKDRETLPEAESFDADNDGTDSSAATFHTTDMDTNNNAPNPNNNRASDKTIMRLEEEELDTPVETTVYPQVQGGTTNDAQEESSIPLGHDDKDGEPPTTTVEPSCVVICDRPISQQLLSQPFVTLCLFFAYHNVANDVWTMTTARDFLKYLGDDDHGNLYLTIFTLATPMSLLGLPFVDVAMHKYGFHAAHQVVNALGIIHGIIKVSSTNLNVQVIGFFLFSFFRCFLFSSSFSCLASFMSKDGMGRGVGILYVVAGVIGFVNIPMVTLAVDRLEGDFFVPNLIYLVLSVPVVYLSWMTGQGLKRNKELEQT